MAHICDWEDIDILVTDSMSPENRESFRTLGVEIKTP